MATFLLSQGYYLYGFLTPLSDQQIIFPSKMVMLWFKFNIGLMFFELVSILFAIFADYGNEYMTKENNN